MVKLLLLLAACQGNSDAPRVDKPPPPHEPGFGNRDAAIAIDAAAVVEEEPPPDSNKTIIRLGAIPAWQAVVDRTRYLARRDQKGVVYGIIAASDPPYTFLVDDTEGNGALGIRAALGMKGAKDGDRVALAGAWKLDDQRRWFWGVDQLTVLPPAAPSESKDPRASQPTHAIQNGELPNGARTIGVAKDGDAAYFTVVGTTPLVDGDGWLVADELGNPAVAALTLPGERASYGGQDMRTSDERWQLKRGQTYWVRLGHFHKHGDKLQTVTARTAPIRVK